METNFDEIINRKGTYSIKYDAAKSFFKDIEWNDDTIPMMIADMDFACPKPIQDALHKVVDNRIYGYTSYGDEYIDAVISWYQKRHNIALSKEWIKYSDGSIIAINNAIETFSNVGDGVIIMRPVYGHFNGMIKDETHRTIVATHLKNDNGYYSIDFEDFEQKCSVATNRIFILCSPANPVGRVFTFDELKKIVEICKKHNVLIISDEIHSDIIRKDNKFVSILEVTNDYSNIILVTGINKSFNTAGLLCSNVIIPDKNLREIFLSTFGFRMPTPFAIAALVAAYNESEKWLDELNAYLDANIDFALDFFAKNIPKLKVYKPEGTYMLWLDFRAYGLSDKEVHERIYKNANVILQDGLVHDPDFGECFQRMCISLPRQVLELALERIAKEFA